MPRKKLPGAREPSGKLARAGRAPILPPAFDRPGLALAASDYVEREVTLHGQVIGRTVQRRGAIDRLPLAGLDGDQIMALRTFEAWHDAVAYPVRSVLDNSPCGGGGMEARVDAQAAVQARWFMLCRALPHELRNRLVAVVTYAIDLRQVKRGDAWVLHQAEVAWLSEAADCLMVALERRKAA